MRSAFTLLELLFVIAVVAVLTAIAIPATTGVTRYAARVKSLSNLRQIGVAARLYANEHNQELPGGPPPAGAEPGSAQWPALFCVYLSPSDPRVFLDPTDPAAAKFLMADVISNTQNNTGYIYNAFDELGMEGAPPSSIPLTRIEHPVNTVLMGQKAPATKTFAVHLILQPLGTLLGLLNPKVFNGGSHYLYVDGSVRFLKVEEYSPRLWLSDPVIEVPGLPPLPTLPPILPPLPGFAPPSPRFFPRFMVH